MDSPVARPRRSAVRRHRPALIVLVVVAAAGCLALGWWQWTRFEAAGGTGQNLGYALQWPLFAAFVVYAYRRFVQLEGEHSPDEDEHCADEDEHCADEDEHCTDEDEHCADEDEHCADEDEHSAREDNAREGERDEANGRALARGEAATEIPADLLPPRPTGRVADNLDEPTAAYNRYLAELYAQDDRRANSQEREHRRSTP